MLTSELFLHVAAFGGLDARVHKRHPHIPEDHMTLLLSLHRQQHYHHPPPQSETLLSIREMPTPGVPGCSTHGGGVLALLHAAVPFLQGLIGANSKVRDLGRCGQWVRAARASPLDLGRVLGALTLQGTLGCPASPHTHCRAADITHGARVT